MIRTEWSYFMALDKFMSYNAFREQRFLKESFFSVNKSLFISYNSNFDLKKSLNYLVSTMQSIHLVEKEAIVKLSNKPIMRLVDNYYKTHSLARFSHVLAQFLQDIALKIFHESVVFRCIIFNNCIFRCSCSSFVRGSIFYFS